MLNCLNFEVVVRDILKFKSLMVWCLSLTWNSEIFEKICRLRDKKTKFKKAILLNKNFIFHIWNILTSSVSKTVSNIESDGYLEVFRRYVDTLFNILQFTQIHSTLFSHGMKIILKYNNYTYFVWRRISSTNCRFNARLR